MGNSKKLVWLLIPILCVSLVILGLQTVFGERPGTLVGHKGDVIGLSFMPNGKALISASRDGTIRFWATSNGRQIGKIEDRNSVISMAVTGDRKLIATGGDEQDPTVHIRDLESGTLLRTIRGHQDSVTSLTFSPRGNVLASGSWDQTIRLWRVDDGALLRTLQGSARISDLSFSPDGKLLAASQADGIVTVWDANSGALLHTKGDPNDGPRGVAFSPDGHVLAVGQTYGGIELWNVRDWKVTTILQANPGWILRLAYSSDGRELASCDVYNGEVRLWEIPSGESSVKIHRPSVRPLSLAFAPTTQVLASGWSGDFVIRLVDDK